MIQDIFENLSPQSLLFLVYAIGFALVSSFFHYRTLLDRCGDDFKAFMRYFFYFFLLLFAVPVVFILLTFSQPLDTLRVLGLQLGDSRLGVWIVLAGIPILAVVSFVSTKNPAIQEQYPFSKKACDSSKKFVLFEMCYLIFYYVAWEFTFRGVILFGLIEWIGENSSGIVIAILIQAIIATVYHLGHPHMEIFGALAGSIIFGIIAFVTGSILYTIFLHAFVGILNDAILYVRFHKNRERARNLS
jgi:membrane protease YdiL (CAAX protease family)